MWVASFLLCFCCEEVAFWIYDTLINEYLPNDYFQKEELFLEKEVKLLTNLGLAFKIFTPEQQQIIEIFLTQKIECYFRTFFVNFLNFQIVYFIWDSLITKGSVRTI